MAFVPERVNPEKLQKLSGAEPDLQQKREHPGGGQRSR